MPATPQHAPSDDASLQKRQQLSDALSLSSNEANEVLRGMQRSSNPISKLQHISKQLEANASQRKQAFDALESHPLLSGLPSEEYRILESALSQVFALPAPQPSEQIPWVSVPTPVTRLDGEDLGFVNLLAELVSNRLAERLTNERFLQQALHTQEREEQRIVLAKYLRHMIDENQALRQEMQVLQKKLASFQPAGLGLWRCVENAH